MNGGHLVALEKRLTLIVLTIRKKKLNKIQTVNFRSIGTLKLPQYNIICNNGWDNWSMATILKVTDEHNINSVVKILKK